MTEGTTKKCLRCKEEMPKEETKCPHCGRRDLTGFFTAIIFPLVGYGVWDIPGLLLGGLVSVFIIRSAKKVREKEKNEINEN